jgi:beta-phosphoglucomutase
MTETEPGVGPLTDVLRRWSQSTTPAALFDFNGTLSDDEPLLLQIFGELFPSTRPALTPTRYYRDLAGRSDREIIKALAAEATDPAETDLAAQLDRRRTRYRELVDARSPVTDGARELVLALHDRRVRLGIVTGAERADVEYVVERTFTPGTFDVVVTASDVTKGKPDPQGFTVAADALGVGPSDVIVFEDSLPGARAARAAGMYCVCVEGTHTRAELEEEADAVVGALTPSLLARAEPES